MNVLRVGTVWPPVTVAGEMDRPDSSRPLLLRLDGCAATVEPFRAAEPQCLEVTGGSRSRRNAKAKRAHEAEIATATDRLAVAVVDLQESHATVRSPADGEGISAAVLRELDESFDAAHREYAGHLAARTYRQVCAGADDRALPVTRRRADRMTREGGAGPLPFGERPRAARLGDPGG